MQKDRSRGWRSLTSPAGLVAILALVISLSGTAYAAAYITGADIVNGSIGKKDLSGAAKKWISQTGVRAVASFGGNGSSCTVDKSGSRGFDTSSCVRNGQGEYTLTLKNSVKTASTAAACGVMYNGGFNATYTFSCLARVNSDGTVDVQLSASDETTTGNRIPQDGGNLYVVVF